jgi:hypothetical protein
MLRCPFCHYDNEDGALFCEQCKSDLAGMEQPAVPVATPIVESVQVVEAAVVVAEATPLELTPVVAETVEASPFTFQESADVPVAPPIVEPMPVEATPLYEAETMAPASPPPAPAADVPPAPVAEMPPPAPAAAPAPAAPAAAPAPAAQEPAAIPAGAQPRLVVLRGQKRNVEYPIYEGQNFIGRADEKPVDIDLEDQEPPDRIWSSRQHALVTLENGQMTIEDLNSSNGTFVNRTKIYPGQPRPLNVNDVVQIGTVQLKLIV